MGPLGGIGLPEVIIVLVIALVIFGPKKLPGLGKSLGSGLREFKESVSGKGSKDSDEIEESSSRPISADTAARTTGPVEPEPATSAAGAPPARDAGS